MKEMPKGQVIRETFSFNLPRDIVALQVEKRCCPYYHRVLNFPRNKFQCCKLKSFVAKSRIGSTLRNVLLRLAILKFVAGQVEHGVATTRSRRSTCNATKLCNKLNENVPSITWP